MAAFARDNSITITISSGYRSYEEQVNSYKKSGGYQDKNGNWTGGDGSAAVPGRSWHEFGEAIDTTTKYIKNLCNGSTSTQTELLKYGLYKPMAAGNNIGVTEDWHIQPIETNTDSSKQSFLDAYK